MSVIVTRAGKGAPLSWVEADANFINLNNDKLEAGTPATNVGFIQAGIGAVARNVQDELRETYKVTQFVVAGETTLDNAFTRAIAAFTRPGTLEIPQGFFNLDAPVMLRSDIPIRIKGAGIYSTVIYCTATGAIPAMFDTPTGEIVDNLVIEDLALLGNGKAQTGIRCEHLIHSMVARVQIQGTTLTAIRFNDGYSNTFEDCQIFSNTGNGVECSGVNNNNINIIRCQIYANDRIGVLAANAWSLNIQGSGIEGNKVAGVMAYDVRGLNITDNYLERNGATGYAYTIASGSPENLTVKADIHLLAGGRLIGLNDALMVNNSRIEGNQLTPYGYGDIPTAGLSQDCFVFAPCAENLTVRNNECNDTAKLSYLVGSFNNNTKARARGLVIDQNSVNSFGFLGTGITSFSFNTLHNIDTPTKQSPHNYMSQDIFDYSILSGSTGYFRRSANDFSGYPVYAVGPGDYLWGFNVDLTKHPELKGKLVWFGVWYHVEDTGSSVVLRLGGNTDSDGSVTDTAFAVGEFRFKSVAKLVGAGDTNLYATIQRIGSGSNPVLICNPIVSLSGFGANRYPIPNVAPVWRRNAAPTEGSWKVGDRVVAKVPTVGQPKAFQVTVTGAPGTWVSEGNL